MPHDVLILVGQVLGGLALLTGLGICGWTAVAVVRAWRGKTIASGAAPERLPPADQRLQRLEQATEAIALEVERIAEGQRFVTKLLSNPEHEPGKFGSGR
ncbi:MAG: hypothetical protein ABI311_09910 [Gemmatimonadaceae bacterium]